MKNIVALFLAGGDSSRCWPLSNKLLLNMLGKPLLFHSITQAAKFGITKIVVVVSKQNEANFFHLTDFFPNLTIDIVKQTDTRDMAGAIISAKKYIAGKSLLVIGPSDIYEDVIFSNFRQLLSTSCDGILAGITVSNYFPGAYLTIDGDKVKTIIEKPSPESVPSNIVNFVFDYFKNANNLLTAIEETKTNKNDHYEKALGTLIKRGQVFKFLRYKGFWGYLKYPWHTLSISSYYLSKLTNQKIKNASIASSAVITGNVQIEDKVKILENAKIIGPTYIGCGTIVGNNCLIRESMVGANCVIGFTSEIARSYVGDNCWFHNNYIGDSVISNNVSMGAGGVIANFRLDETTIKSRIADKTVDTGKVKLGTMVGTNTHIGVNVSVMPGIKIGNNSFIGAGVVLDRDLADNKFCKIAGHHYDICENKISVSDKFRREREKSLKL